MYAHIVLKKSYENKKHNSCIKIVVRKRCTMIFRYKSGIAVD